MMVIGALFVLVCLAINVRCSQDVMKEISLDFTRPLADCKKEMDLPDSVRTDFYHFWKEDYEVTDRFTGCAIICVASKLDILDHTLHMHPEKAEAFTKKHGADEEVSKTLLNLVRQCDSQTEKDPDGCIQMLNMAKCFKAEIHKLDWAPTMDMVLEEFLADI